MKRKGRRKRPVVFVPDTQDETNTNHRDGLVPSEIAPANETNSVQAEREFLNKEASWLEFNRRVLHEATDPRTPLLERIKFLGIFNSNLDEFFMKRIGGIKRQIVAGITRRNIDGFTPQEVVLAAREKILPLLIKQAETFSQVLKPALAQNGLRLLAWADIDEQEKLRARKYFRENVFPVLTPLAVDPGHPFPFLSNLSTSLGVTLTHPDRTDELLFARIKIPKILPRWIRIDSGQVRDNYRFVSLQDMIQHNLHDLFPNMKIVSVMPFRITRNADIERDEEDAEDLLELIEDELKKRRFATIVRLEHGPNPDPWIRTFLMEELDLNEEDVYEVPSELDYTDLYSIYELNIPQLKYDPWSSVVPPLLMDDEVNIFSVIRKNDLLVHHPYESFNASVERFIDTAADDPRVIAIKMTLYRTDTDSPFVSALTRAAENGKQVVSLVEVKARFDEEKNIRWAQELERAGVHVVYGIVGLKTHAKVALVIRRDPDGLRSYVHIGTGNYHTGTAKLYTDLGYLTCKPDVTEDVVELFHYLTGRSLKMSYKKLLVAPVSMKDQFLGMIEREVRNRQEGKPAHIIAKMNSLDSVSVIRALCKASQAGVPIDLVIRGVCCLKPGLPGISENIRVISVIGRFLEHSRIFYFRNGAADGVDGEFYMGSADWMDRNLHGRVEAIVPLEEKGFREKAWEVLQTLLRDNRQAWDMQPDGSYVQRQPRNEGEEVGTHQNLMKSVRLLLASQMPHLPKR